MLQERSNKLSRSLTSDHLELKGLRAASSQVWGSVRLVPLIREHVREDFRIAKHLFPESTRRDVTVKGTEKKPRVVYSSYIPHGLIVSHGHNASDASVAWQTQLGHADKKRDMCVAPKLHKMVKRLGPGALRMLPMHMALEGFLTLHFGGPDVAYNYYSKRSLRYGLSPRVEYGITGTTIPDLGPALAKFEIHKNQCGVLIYVGDALASAFVVGHPKDYVRLHQSVLEDLYAELFWYYGLMYRHLQTWQLDIKNTASIHDLASLKSAYHHALEELHTFEVMDIGRELIQRELRKEKLYSFSNFVLERFMTDIEDTEQEINHIGERITSKQGELMYLKTFRLSSQQVEKARLLKLLADHQWDLYLASVHGKMSAMQLKDRIVKAGFGYVLRHGANTRL